MNTTATKRKTVTSSEVKARWIAQNYKRFVINLRYDIDGDLITYLENSKGGDGKGTTEIIRTALRAHIKNGG